MKGSSLHLSDLKFISETTAARTPPPPNLNTLTACVIKPLRTLGITGFHDLIATDEQFLLSGNQLKQKCPMVYKKHITAINRLAEIVNLPSTEDLTAEADSSSSTENNLSTTPYFAHVKSTTPHSQRYGTLESHNFIETPAQFISANQNTQPHPPTVFHPVPSPQPRSTKHATHPITGRTVTQVNLPASHDPFDPSTPTARNQDTPLPSQVIPKNLTQDQPRPTTCITLSMAATQSLHTTNFGPQAINPPPNSIAANIALPITQTIDNPYSPIKNIKHLPLKKHSNFLPIHYLRLPYNKLQRT